MGRHPQHEKSVAEEYRKVLARKKKTRAWYSASINQRALKDVFSNIMIEERGDKTMYE